MILKWRLSARPLRGRYFSDRRKDFLLIREYISREAQCELLCEVSKVLRKASWNSEHFDSVIVNYRESSVGFSSRIGLYPAINRLYDKIQNDFFADGKKMLDPHVLQLAPEGYILPHLDNYCGDRIVGVSLVGERVLKFCRRSDQDALKILLPARSLYLQAGLFRTEYEHEILKDHKTPPEERISIIFRENHG